MATPNLSTISTTAGLDAASASLSTLRELLQSGELELLSEKPGTAAQKTARLNHIASSLQSPELQKQFEERITVKDFAFFSSHNLHEWINEQQKEIEKIGVVRLEVAITFKSKDIEGFRTLLQEKIGRAVVLDLVVEHSLVGGAIIQHGTYRMDASLKSRLERFGTSLQKATR